MKKLLLSMLGCAFYSCINAQVPLKKTFQWVDLAATAGSSRAAVAASYAYNWRFGKKQKFSIGLGTRLTTAFGEKQEYITAPAKLSRTNTIPFIIVFAGQNIVNWDTLIVQRPLTASVNLTANAAYALSSKWGVGLNIDLIGFTLGKATPAILVSNGKTTAEPNAKPAAFNALLTGDLDYGSLNSEFFLQYQIKKNWHLRGVYQFLFSEYKTSSVFQTAPDGTIVNRFRNKANNIGIAVSFYF